MESSNLQRQQQQRQNQLCTTTTTGDRSTGGCEVQYLSNKACVHIMVGNYFKANRILESAIRKHTKDNASNIRNYYDLYPYFSSDDSMLDVDTEVDKDDDERLFTNSTTIYYDHDHCYYDGHSLQQQETQSISATTETETDNDTFSTSVVAIGKL